MANAEIEEIIMREFGLEPVPMGVETEGYYISKEERVLQTREEQAKKKAVYKKLQSQSFEEILAHYEEKERILSVFGERVSPETLYEDIFGCDLDEIMMPVVIIDKAEQKHIAKMTISDAISRAKNNSDTLLGGATYYNNFISKRTAKDIYTLIIDMDNVYAPQLKVALQQDWATNTGYVPPRPTYIVNSGTGLHLYFVFDKPIPAWNKQKLAIDMVYSALCKAETQKKRPYVLYSKQWFGQDFRMVGGDGKYGWENTAYRYGSKWDPNELAKELGVDVHFRFEGDDFEPKVKKVTHKKKGSRRKGYYLNEAVYNNTLERCKNEVMEGHRYTSMCALSVIAWKCKIPLSRLEEDLYRLLPIYNSNCVTLVRKEEIDSAIKMYNERAIDVPRERTEDWLGWKYIGSKRNGRTRHEHLWDEYWAYNGSDLPKVNICRMNRELALQHMRIKGEIKGAPTKQEQIKQWRKEHPDGRKVDCQRELGISKPTVLKWW